jgi:predicted small secreted protein
MSVMWFLLGMFIGVAAGFISCAVLVSEKIQQIDESGKN